MYLNSKLNSGGLVDICSTADGYDIFNSVVLTNIHKLESGTSIVKNSSRSDILARECLGTPHGVGNVIIADDTSINSTRTSKLPGQTYQYYKSRDITDLLDEVIKLNTLTARNRL